VQVDLQVDFSKAGAWANLQTVSRIGSILLSAVDRPAVECAKKYVDLNRLGRLIWVQSEQYKHC